MTTDGSWRPKSHGDLAEKNPRSVEGQLHGNHKGPWEVSNNSDTIFKSQNQDRSEEKGKRNLTPFSPDMAWVSSRKYKFFICCSLSSEESWSRWRRKVPSALWFSSHLQSTGQEYVGRSPAARDGFCVAPCRRQMWMGPDNICAFLIKISLVTRR